VRIEGSHAAIVGLGTAVPEYQLDQAEVAQRLTEALGRDTDSARWVDRLFKRSGVENRYTCVPNLLEPVSRCRFLPNWPLNDVPTTAERMEVYKRESIRLGVSAAKKALASSDLRNDDLVEEVAGLTHLIAVSCTGFFIPGLDIALIKQLQLPLNINRICLTFMGCAAGMTALRLASQIVEGNTSARVLVVSVELCTLHVQPTSNREGLFATALFGDGAAACVVGSPTVERRGIFEFDGGHASIIPDTQDAMTWDVGNYGFELYLSPKLPDHLAQFAPSEIKRFLGTGPKPEFWAIHPGGRGIVDVLQRLLGLTGEQTEASRSILRRYGNLSSATIFFVLDKMRRQFVRDEKADQQRRGIAIAFGPGLSIEMLRLTWQPTGEV